MHRFFLRCYASKTVDKAELNNAVKSIESIGTHKQKPAIKQQKCIDAYKSLFFSVIRLNNQEVTIKRRELVEIFNNGLYHALKVDNVKQEK